MLTESTGDGSWWAWSLSNVLSASQAAFTILGFTIAIVQLWRTANASVESRRLLKRLRVRLIGNDLLVLLPELHQLEDAIDEAVRVPDAPEVEKLLVRYIRRASEVVGLLETEEDLPENGLIPLLKQATSASQKAKAEIAQGGARALTDMTKVVSARIATASQEISSFRAKIQKKGD